MSQHKFFVAIFLCCFALATFTAIGQIRRLREIGPDPDPAPPLAPASNPVSPATPPRDEDHSQSGHAEAVSSPEPAPEYAWLKTQTESFLVDPGQTLTFPVEGAQVANADQPYSPHLVRFDVKSSSGVDAGAMDEDMVNYFGSALTLCYTAKTLQSEHTCRLTGSGTQGVIVIRDPRPSGAQAAIPALAVAILGSKEPLKQATRENRVTVTFYEWHCIQFCL